MRSNIRRVSSNFLALKNAIKSELETPTDGREAVSVSDAVDKIMNSPTADLETHDKSILKSSSEQLRACKNVQGVLDCLGLDWDYLNPDIYADLISDFSLHSLQKQLEEYQRELDQFLEETPVKQFSAVIPKKKHRKIPEEFKNLVTHHKWKSPVYLKDVEIFRREVAAQYNLRRCAVFITGLGIHSVVVTLLLPASPILGLLSTDPKFLCKHNIMTMMYDGIPVHVSNEVLYVGFLWRGWQGCFFPPLDCSLPLGNPGFNCCSSFLVSEVNLSTRFLKETLACL